MSVEEVETLDMLQAMGTGHDGSTQPVHSNNPRECMCRLETLVQYAEAGLSPKAIREMIAAAVHFDYSAIEIDDGSRRVTYITEIGGMQERLKIPSKYFYFEQKGFDKRKNSRLFSSLWFYSEVYRAP